MEISSAKRIIVSMNIKGTLSANITCIQEMEELQSGWTLSTTFISCYKLLTSWTHTTQGKSDFSGGGTHKILVLFFYS